MKMFVYGTLKRGYANNRYMEGCEFIGEATSLDANYSMHGGGVPFLSEPGDKKVKGELWEVTAKAREKIDRLEGHPHAYRREKRQFVLENGHLVTAWVYLMMLHRHQDDELYYGDVLFWPPERNEEADENSEFA